jgi:hypothetical protein
VTTVTLPQQEPLGRRFRRVMAVMGGTLLMLLPEARKRSKPAGVHIRDNGYSILGLGCISAAAFVHSPFTGLLVLGIAFLIFEWKVSEE